ncbi:hypothetical protein H4R33_002878 [Dimargaris cristalligena]|uniref:Uncharacterized protein n=1 Tax=Dimargaris cristalligena TaxID=215637 RepID=A0A4P9ZWU2_9FUNG|nr:hypothetical protein H4R33_002878 [Dimargaris cristalligena]RKP38097.1 hypothetical protein BJ085DRAFT_36500 [Dimargaris cristalligena]|eukprot:RKP38097.1 hypothetical protein BJ085DRAFT_36500 [Dimargaris cristalligena]
MSSDDTKPASATPRPLSMSLSHLTRPVSVMMPDAPNPTDFKIGSMSIPEMIQFDRDSQDLTFEVPEHILYTVNSAKLAAMTRDKASSSYQDLLNQSMADMHQRATSPSPDPTDYSGASSASVAKPKQSFQTHHSSTRDRYQASLRSQGGGGGGSGSGGPQTSMDGTRGAVISDYPTDSARPEPLTPADIHLAEKQSITTSEHHSGPGKQRNESKSSFASFFTCCFGSSSRYDD